MRNRFIRRAGMLVGLAMTAVTGTACYHTIITTDLPPSTEVHHEPWKASFIAGLVPAQVDASKYCEGRRWARVETQMSFLNWVVSAITGGIFTPMDIKVTCAASGALNAPGDAATLRVTAAATEEMKRDVLETAVEVARVTGEAVYVAF